MTMAHFYDPIDGNDQGGFMSKARENGFKVGDKVLVIRCSQYNGYRANFVGDGIYKVTKVTKHNVFVNIWDENEHEILTANNKFNKFGIRMKRHKYPYKYKEFFVLYTKNMLGADIVETLKAAGYQYLNRKEDIENLYKKIAEL